MTKRERKYGFVLTNIFVEANSLNNVSMCSCSNIELSDESTAIVWLQLKLAA